MVLYGCAIKNCKQWREIGQLREAAMDKRLMQNEHLYNEYCLPLWELQICNSVQIQNQDDPYTCQWTKSGGIAEILSNRQYCVQMDRSNYVILFNRHFL